MLHVSGDQFCEPDVKLDQQLMTGSPGDHRPSPEASSLADRAALKVTTFVNRSQAAPEASSLADRAALKVTTFVNRSQAAPKTPAWQIVLH